MLLIIRDTLFAITMASAFAFISCGSNHEAPHLTNIKVTLVDKETQNVRTDLFDTVEVWRETFGFIKSFELIEKRVTDSAGSFYLKIDNRVAYKFILRRMYHYASTTTGSDLKERQQVKLEVIANRN